MRYYVIIFLIFFSFKIYAQATYTSSNNGAWNSSSSWTLTSGNDDDLNGYPDSNDDVIITNGFTITLTQTELVKNLNINAGGTLAAAGRTIGVRGTNITNDGSITGSIRMTWVNANPCTLSTSTNLDIRYLNLTNNTNLTYTASGGSLTILQFDIRSGSTFNNFGDLSVSSLSNQNSSNNFLNNHPGSSFSVATTIPSSGFTITNSNGSTFTYTGAASIFNTSYHHLNFSGTNTKTASSNLNINGNLSISSGTLSLGNNSISVTGNLTNSGTISSSGTINVAGDLSFSATGNLVSNNTSTIVMNGSSAQSITNSNSSTVPLYNFTSSNNSGVTLSSGNFSIKNILTVTSGALNVGTDQLTMLSDASSTAIIGNSAGTINGNMILQRYIQAGVYRKYDLGSTVTSTTIDDWDNELFMSIGATNDGSTPAYLGGDGAAGGKKSVFIYDNQLNTSKKYVAVNTGTTLTPGRGYQTLIADDLTGFPGRAIDSRGTPNMGSISLPVFINGTDGFNLVANPFQAEIDWANVTKSNVSNTVYFIEYNGTKSTYLTPLTNPKINPGLGFMCVATGANPSVLIPQSAKTLNTASTFGARLSQLTDEVSDLKLRISSTQNAEYNEADLFFDKKAISGFDFEKDFLFGESLIENAPIITFTDSGKQFVRNYFNDEIETVYFPLSITTPIAGNYSIDLEGLYESNAYQDAYLMNNLTKEKFKLTNNQTASIYFDKNTHEQFQLVLSKKSSDEINSAATSNLINVFATASDIVIKNGTINQQQVSIRVYSALGQLILNQSSELSEKSELRIPTETFKSDVYFVQLRTALGNEFTKKIVITK
jgi:hypothetical protein